MIALTPPSIIDITIIYLILFIVYYGWGYITAKAFSIDLGSQTAWLVPTIWLGWAAVLFLMQALHLFLAIDWRVSGSIFIIGLIIGLYRSVLEIITYYNKSGFKLSRWVLYYAFFLYIILFVSLWAASRGLQEPSNYDSGLYHFSIIRWINSYPIIPGLGNLHGRLAFNQSYFLYVASLNLYPYYPYAQSIANSFLFTLTITTLIWDLFMPGVTKQDQLVFRLSRFIGLVIVLFLGFTSNNNLSSPSPDLPVSLIQVIIFLWFIDVVLDLRKNNIPKEKIFVLFVLSITLATIKLSSLVFVVSIAVICITFMVLKIENKIIYITQNYRVILILAAIPLVWMIRGIFYSGFPIYPVSTGGIKVEWAVPVEKVQEEADLIYSWARSPGNHPSEVLGNNDWVRPWLSKMYHNKKKKFVYPILLTLAIGCVTLILALFLKKTKKLLSDLVITIPVLAGLLYWFITAPDLGFAHALFYLLPMSIFIVLLLILFDITHSGIVNRIIVSILIILALKILSPYYPEVSFSFNQEWTSPQKAVVETLKTNTGLSVFVPTKGDQCWDSPLPCTPYFNPKLTLRSPGDLGSGFTVK